MKKNFNKIGQSNKDNDDLEIKTEQYDLDSEEEEIEYDDDSSEEDTSKDKSKDFDYGLVINNSLGKKIKHFEIGTVDRKSEADLYIYRSPIGKSLEKINNEEELTDFEVKNAVKNVMYELSDIIEEFVDNKINELEADILDEIKFKFVKLKDSSDFDEDDSEDLDYDQIQSAFDKFKLNTKNKMIKSFLNNHFNITEIEEKRNVRLDDVMGNFSELSDRSDDWKSIEKKERERLKKETGIDYNKVNEDTFEKINLLNQKMYKNLNLTQYMKEIDYATQIVQRILSQNYDYAKLKEEGSYESINKIISFWNKWNSQINSYRSSPGLNDPNIKLIKAIISLYEMMKEDVPGLEISDEPGYPGMDVTKKERLLALKEIKEEGEIYIENIADTSDAELIFELINHPNYENKISQIFEEPLKSTLIEFLKFIRKYPKVQSFVQSSRILGPQKVERIYNEWSQGSPREVLDLVERSLDKEVHIMTGLGEYEKRNRKLLNDIASVESAPKFFEILNNKGHIYIQGQKFTKEEFKLLPRNRQVFELNTWAITNKSEGLVKFEKDFKEIILTGGFYGNIINNLNLGTLNLNPDIFKHKYFKYLETISGGNDNDNLIGLLRKIQKDIIDLKTSQRVHDKIIKSVENLAKELRTSKTIDWEEVEKTLFNIRSEQVEEIQTIYKIYNSIYEKIEDIIIIYEQFLTHRNSLIPNYLREDYSDFIEEIEYEVKKLNQFQVKIKEDTDRYTMVTESVNGSNKIVKISQNLLSRWFGKLKHNFSLFDKSSGTRLEISDKLDDIRSLANDAMNQLESRKNENLRETLNKIENNIITSKSLSQKSLKKGFDVESAMNSLRESDYYKSLTDKEKHKTELELRRRLNKEVVYDVLGR